MSIVIPTATPPTVHYEDYGLPCFTLNSGNAPTNFIRSQFDYGVRQRRAVRGYVSFNVRIILEYWQYLNFYQLWSATNFGTDKFYTDQPVNGDMSHNKIVRFKSGYNVRQLGGRKFEVTVPIETIQSGTNINKVCPLEPSNFIIAKDGLEPC